MIGMPGMDIHFLIFHYVRHLKKTRNMLPRTRGYHSISHLAMADCLASHHSALLYQMENSYGRKVAAYIVGGFLITMHFWSSPPGGHEVTVLVAYRALTCKCMVLS